jgi:putative membrane protein
MALTPEGLPAAREPGTGPGAGETGTAGGTGPGAGNTRTADAGWLRVHPGSPFVRGWVAVAALFFFFGRDSFERLLQGGPVFDERFAGRAPWLLLGGGTLLLLTVLGFVLSWYFTRYQVADGYVRVNTGFLFRQQRQARLDRVQAIDVVQPLLARIFGLAELRFEVADAGESAVHLAYLRADEARQLRATILAGASGGTPPLSQATEPGQREAAAVEAPQRTVLTVPPSRLMGSVLLSEQGLAIVAGGAASVLLSAVTENRSFTVFLIPAVIGLAASYWSSFNKGYNFTAAVSPDGIRLRYGLLDTQAQTVPPGRIQALKISQPPLWRLFGWYRIQINVAGYGLAGSARDGSHRTTLLPVGSLTDVLKLLALVLPDPGTADPAGVFTAGINGLADPTGTPDAGTPDAGTPDAGTPDTGTREAGARQDADGGFVTTPRRARLLAPLGWRRNGFTATETALLLRSGRWWRNLVVVPHQRTQSMALQQGPLARRFRVADLVLHTTAGPVAPRLIQAGLDEARALLDAQAARARAARKRQTSEHWMEPTTPPAQSPAPDTQEGPHHG